MGIQHDSIPDGRTSSRLAALAETVFLLAGIGLLASRLGPLVGIPTRASRDQLLFDPSGPLWGPAAAAETLWLTFRYGLTFALIILLCLWRRGPRPRDAGLAAADVPLTKLLLLGVSAALVSQIPVKGAILLDRLFALGQQTPVWELMNRFGEGRDFWLFMAASSFGMVPIVEELFFRGYAMARYRENFSEGGVLLLSSVFFWISHGQYLKPDPYLLFHSSMVFVTALLLGWMTLRTRSLIPAIVCHAVFNVPLLSSLSLAAYIAAGIIVLIVGWSAVRSAVRDLAATVAATTEWRFLMAITALLTVLAVFVKSAPVGRWVAAVVLLALASVSLFRRAPRSVPAG